MWTFDWFEALCDISKGSMRRKVWGRDDTAHDIGYYYDKSDLHREVRVYWIHILFAQ